LRSGVSLSESFYIDGNINLDSRAVDPINWNRDSTPLPAFADILYFQSSGQYVAVLNSRPNTARRSLTFMHAAALALLSTNRTANLMSAPEFLYLTVQTGERGSPGPMAVF
jgi:hypothetical protein